MDYIGIPQTWIWGVDFKDLSTMDYWMAADVNPSYMVKQGLGSVVARLASNLPTQINTPVTAINWNGDDISVTTSAGTIRANACIVTVSTGVLASDSIKFNPRLPNWKQQAIHDLPMGLLAKVTLQFDSERLGLRPNDWLSYWVPNEMPAEACYFLSWPFNYDLMIGFIGGAFGWQLSEAGTIAAVDFALTEIVKMLGSNVKKHFIKGHLTGWASNPLTLGAYTAARPGHYGARAELAKPLGEKLFLRAKPWPVPM